MNKEKENENYYKNTLKEKHTHIHTKNQQTLNKEWTEKKKSTETLNKTQRSTTKGD